MNKSFRTVVWSGSIDSSKNKQLIHQSALMSFHYIKMHVHDVHFQYSLDEKDKRWVNNDRILIFGWNTALTLSVRMHVHKHLPLISSVISTASLKLITTGLSLTANDGKETLMRVTRFRRTLVNQLNETATSVWVNSSVVTKPVQWLLAGEQYVSSPANRILLSGC